MVPEILRIYENDLLYGFLMLLNIFILFPLAVGCIFGFTATVLIWVAMLVGFLLFAFTSSCY